MAEHNQHASKASEQAMHENDEHNNAQGKANEAIPGDASAHSHSHAAHTGTLGKTNDANQSGGSRTGELREPVMDRTRRHDEPQRKNG